MYLRLDPSRDGYLRAYRGGFPLRRSYINDTSSIILYATKKRPFVATKKRTKNRIKDEQYKVVIRLIAFIFLLFFNLCKGCSSEVTS